MSDAVCPAGRRSVALAAALALAIGALLQLGGALRPLETATQDLLGRAFAPAGPVAGVLSVDIDEASIRALRPRFGGWPPDRALLALVSDYLLEIGASAVAIDLVLADPRPGDAALATAIGARAGRIVLAASALSRAEGADSGARGPGGCPGLAWTGLLLPADALLAAQPGGTAIGMVSTPADADGLLRTLPLWHSAGGRTLPALPLAAVLASLPAPGADAGRVRCAEGRLQLGTWTVPLDGAGRLQPAWHGPAGAVPALPYERVAQAALGARGDAGLCEQVRGRIVFIGASGALDSEVQTPVGARSGAALLAETAAALLPRGHALAAGRWPVDALAWLLACVPALAAWRRSHLHAGADAAWAGAGLLALGLGVAVLHGALAQQAHALAPACALVAYAALSLVLVRRAMLDAQLRLQRERSAAEAASRVKSEFLAHVSHEIRTPMNALLGAADLLSSTRLDARQRRHVDLFQSAGASLMAILDDLLDLSKIEAGLLEPTLQPFSLVELVAHQATLFEARAAQKGLRLHTEADPLVPPVVRGDPQRLAQVLRNLLGNAVKFTHDGSVTLRVRTVPGRPGRVRFEVADTGIGIAPGQQETIFGAFTQADGGIARVYGGTGLGLAISRQLALLMGGEIGVDSQPGAGATFHVELDLPASREEPLPIAPLSRPAPLDALDSAASPVAGLRLLVADDNPQNVALVEAYLEGDGHHLEVVQDGEAALEAFRRGRFDAVLMDVQMPRLDGYRATAALRAIEAERGDPPVPVIALTANAMPGDARRSLEAGCTAHLSKPFSRAQLRDLLAAVAAGAPTAAEPAASAPTAPPPSALPEPLPTLAALPGFDLPAALARMNGQSALYLRLLHASGDLLAGWLGRFAEVDRAGEPSRARRLAHDLKSTAATLGAVDLAAAAQRLEDELAAPQAQRNAAQVAAAVDAVRPPLQALLAVLGKDAEHVR